MSTTQNGFLIIADITGYTAFLSDSELEHAEDSLRSLINLIIEHTQLPLVISRLEGDAVISYADERSFLQGQTLVEMIESTYVAFKRAIDLMVLNTSCSCNACRNIPNLDLKFFVHFGTYMLQKLPAYTELIGSDVNLVHRLTKNTIIEQFNFKAYVVYSKAAVDALGILEIAKTMSAHSEEYTHIGTVEMFIQDMHMVWERDKERNRLLVEPGTAKLVVEHQFPFATVLMWEYVTGPEFKAILTLSNTANVDQKKNGRIGSGSAYLCAHGNNVSPQTILDWQPFEQYTTHNLIAQGVFCFWTTRLVPTEFGTNVITMIGEAQGGNGIVRWLINALAYNYVRKVTLKGLRMLHSRMESDLAQGIISEPEIVEFSPETIRESIAKQLAG
jgi:hypothetical protein